MFGLFTRRACGPIALDVGAEGVRMLQLAGAGDHMSVAAAGRWHFPAGAADEPARIEAVAAAVRELLKNGNFVGREVVSCLRANDMHIKNIRMPHMPDAELEKAVLWECQERLGFTATPDRIHHINAGEVRQGAETRDEIILTAITEEAIASHLDMLARMRVTPVHIDAEPLALFRAYERLLRRAEDVNAVSVVVDVGLSATKVVVARGHTPVLIKCIDIAGQNFNQSVARELNLTPAEAAQVRKPVQGDPGGDERPAGARDARWSVLDAIRGQVESLAGEIAMCLRYCSVTFRGLRPARVIVAGGEAYDGGLLKSLSEGLGCQCVLGEPLRGVDLSGADLGGDRRSMLSEWSVAVGLALRERSSRQTSESDTYATSRIPA
jgi:type IV pilus assembly protein PilM